MVIFLTVLIDGKPHIINLSQIVSISPIEDDDTLYKFTLTTGSAYSLPASVVNVIRDLRRDDVRILGPIDAGS
jgi:hypothetical protein